jgi:hypothetical protein
MNSLLAGGEQHGAIAATNQSVTARFPTLFYGVERNTECTRSHFDVDEAVVRG